MTLRVDFEVQLGNNVKVQSRKGFARKLDLCTYRIQDAEAMGWPALAQSWRRDLKRVQALQDKLPPKPKAPYKPRGGSLASHVIAFFENNPGEELARDDIVAKFNADRDIVAASLSLAVRSGLLTQTGAGAFAVWRAPQPLRRAA